MLRCKAFSVCGSAGAESRGSAIAGRAGARRPRPIAESAAIVNWLFNCSGLSKRSNSSIVLPSSVGSRCRRSYSPRWLSNACTPLPIRLAVVSWPALSRKMQLCSSSSAVSCSPSTSPWISRVNTSASGSPGWARRSATRPSRAARNALTAAWPRASSAASGAGSSADRIASDQARRAPRPACGIASRLPIPSTGIRAANYSIRSACGPSAWSSSTRRSTSVTTPASMRVIARWFMAPINSRRARVCSGGSLNTRLVVWCS